MQSFSHQLLAIQSIPLEPRSIQSNTINNNLCKSPTHHIPCKFHLIGQCQAGNQCSFSHSYGSAPLVCKYHKKNTCKFRANCMLSHPTPKQNPCQTREHVEPNHNPSLPVPIPSTSSNHVTSDLISFKSSSSCNASSSFTYETSGDCQSVNSFKGVSSSPINTSGDHQFRTIDSCSPSKSQCSFSGYSSHPTTVSSTKMYSSSTTTPNQHYPNSIKHVIPLSRNLSLYGSPASSVWSNQIRRSQLETYPASQLPLAVFDKNSVEHGTQAYLCSFDTTESPSIYPQISDMAYSDALKNGDTDKPQSKHENSADPPITCTSDSFNWVDDHHYILPSSLSDLLTAPTSSIQNPSTVHGFSVASDPVTSKHPEQNLNTPCSVQDNEPPSLKQDHLQLSDLGHSLSSSSKSSLFTHAPALWSPAESTVSLAYGSSTSRRPSGPSPWNFLPTSPANHFALTSSLS